LRISGKLRDSLAIEASDYRPGRAPTLRAPDRDRTARAMRPEARRRVSRFPARIGLSVGANGTTRTRLVAGKFQT